MMGRCSSVMAGLVDAVFLIIVLVASPALCRRPEPPHAGVRLLTYASSNNAVAINSTALLDESKDCDLVFCTEHVCKVLPTCYCCEPDPRERNCYSSREVCRENCPVCKNERSQ